jgi:hypothetical protein
MSPGGGAGLGTDFVALTKLFGAHNAFTAKLDMRVYNKDQKETASVPMAFAKLDDKIRLDLDITQVKNDSMPASSGAALKMVNMDRIVVMVRPDQNLRYVIFPGIQSCLNNPLSAEEVASLGKKVKLETTAQGKETIDGQPCVKNKVVSTDEKGNQTEYTVWNATALKDFPVQIMTKEKTDTVIMRYKDVKFVKPDTKQFEKPADFTEYADAKDMMTAVMMKLATEAGGTPTTPGVPDTDK